jgi:hypothetical protein
MKKLNLLALIISMVSGWPCFAQDSTLTATLKLGEPNKSSSWAASYFNYINGPALSEPSNGMSINHYIGLKYKFESKWAASLTLRPDSNFENGEEEYVSSDPYVRIEYPTLFEAKNGLKITGNLNYFAPASEASKENKLQGSVAPRFLVAQDIGNWSLSYLLIPRAYFYSEKSDGQITFSHGHYLAAAYNISDFVIIEGGIYPAWTEKRNERTIFNDLLAYPGMTFNFTKKFSLSPYVEIPLMKAEQKNAFVGASVSYRLL